MGQYSFRYRKRLSLKIILVYTMVGFIWLISADLISASLSLSAPMRNFVKLVAGLMFVVATSLLFFYALNRYLHHLQLSRRALKRSEQRLRTLINTIPDFVLLYGVDGKTLEANQAAQDFLGIEKEHLIGKSMAELAEHNEKCRSLYPICLEIEKEGLNKKGIHRSEHVIKHNGTTQYFEKINVPIVSTQEAIESILVIGRNITERKQVEDELRMTKNQLENFISSSADAILFYDIDGTIRRVNHAFEGMYGWKADEIVGRRAAVTIPPEYKKDANELFYKLAAGEQVIGHETVRQKKDGTTFHVSMTFSPIKNSKGEVIGVSGIIRDITERKKSEELLRKSDMLSVVGQLAAGVAHEIRNPLTALKGFVQLSKEEQAYNAAYTDIILSELDRINTIVNEFMVLAKPQVMSFEQRNINRLLQEIITIIGTQAILHNIEIVQLFDPQLPDLMCEENQLKQVFINVLKNSIEAMPTGGKITIETARHDKEHVRVTVTDEGQGIPTERIKRLGEPFYTTKEKGTGLGLMISYKIIRAHEGYMEIQSELGQGTIVVILLPLKH